MLNETRQKMIDYIRLNLPSYGFSKNDIEQLINEQSPQRIIEYLRIEKDFERYSKGKLDGVVMPWDC